MDKKVEVINKFGQTLAIFTSEDEETVDRMIDPVVTLTQNSDNVFSFSISEKSQKWEDIKSVENLYVVDGHVYSPLFADSYNVVKSEDGQNLIQVRAYERQKMLEKVYVTAWNSETGFADIDAFMVVILSKGNLPLKNGNKATGVEAIVDPGEYSLGSAGYIMAGLLYGTGWNVGIVDVEGYFDFETEQLSVYENLLKVQELYGGILIFDSMNKIVHLRQESNYISYTGYEVRYKKNLKDMDLAIDNKIVTRLYVFGEAGLNIASVNDSKIYLENYTYSNEVFEGIESNTDIYEPDQLKAWGERKLLDLCAPRKVLTTNIAYLTQKEGFEQEKLKLNDSVRVYYDEAEFVAPEEGVEIVATEIEAEGVKAKKESYITLKGNTSQETVTGEDGKEVIDTDIAITDADIEKENYIELQGNTSQDSTTGKNLFDTNYYLETQYGTGGGVLVNTAYFKDGENITTDVSLASGRRFFNHKKLSAGTYTVSFNKSFSGTEHHIRYSVRDFVNLIDIVATSSMNDTNTRGSFSFTLTEETDVYISIQPYSTDTGTLTLSNIQLEQGSTATDWEKYTGGIASPNPNYPSEVKAVTGENVVSVENGANIFDIEEYAKNNSNYFSYDKTNGLTILKQDNRATANVNPIFNVSGNTTYHIKCNDGATMLVSEYTKGNVWAKNTFLTNGGSFKTRADVTYIRIKFTATKFPFVIGNVSISEMEDYIKQDYPINLGSLELCKIGDYQDYLYKDSGKWYVHKEIGKYEFDENTNFVQNWNRNTDNKTYCMYRVLETNFGRDAIAISNILPYVSSIYAYDKIGIYQEKNSGGRIIFRVPKTIANSVSEFQTWLASNSMIVYTLIAPTEEEITNTSLIAQLEALYTAKLAGSTTYISTVADDLEPFIDLKYNVITQVPSPQKPSEVQVVTGNNVISVQGKNLLPINSNVTQYGITSIKNEDGSISFNGTATSTYCYITNKTLVELPIGTYAFSINKVVNYGVRLQLEFEDGTLNNALTIAAGRTSVSVTTAKIVKTIRIYLIGLTSGTEYNDTLYLQLEQGSTATPYEPYQKTSYTVNFGDLELCNINDYQDYIFKNSIENPHYNPDLELNAWYKYKTIDKVVLNGSENWNKTNLFYASVFVPRRALVTGNTIGLYSPYFRYSYNASDSNSIFVPGTIGEGNSYMWLKTDVATTVADFKTWLSNNNVTVYYVLATPIDEKITDLALTTQLEALYKGTLVSPYSHIYSDSGFPIIDLRYNVITPSLYIDSNSDLLRVTGVDYPVFNPSSATLTLGDVTLNTNDIFKKISNTTNAYTGGLIPAGSVRTTTYDGISKPITQEFETQHSLNSTFQYGIDSLNLSVSNISTLVDENGDEIKTLEEHIGEVEVTAEGLKTTVTNRSGNNLLRNSSALFREEFWRGEVVQSTATEVQQNFFAKSCFYLQNGTLGQQIAVPNGDYYIGFKYKKLVELANCVVSVNGSPITLDEMEYTTADEYITVNDNHIDIEIKSDTGNSCYIGDIMVVAGNKEKWSPNPNEIFYDTVEIGKGIQVNSNTANSYTRIDADGNRIYNKTSDEIVTELTDEGMITNKVYCEQLTAAGVLHQVVIDKYGDEQSWETKI